MTDTTKPPKPKPVQIDAHFVPRPAAAQKLGFNAQITDRSAVELVAASGAKVIRGGGAWSGVEDAHTGNLALSVNLAAGLKHAASLGLEPMLVAAYGSPYAPLMKVRTTAPVAVGAYTIPVTVKPSSYVAGADFVTGVHGGILTERHSYAGSLLLGSVYPNTLQLAAALSKAIPSGTELAINRCLYPSPGDRGRLNTSRAAFVRYARFLADQIVAAGANGTVCIYNEPPWPDDLWIDRRDSYDNPPPGMSGGAMHTLLAAFFGTRLPAGVRFVSGATDKNGGPASVLRQYQEEVTGNKGANYIPTPTPDDLAGWLVAEGIHPYGGHQPEAEAWDDEFAMLSPIENQSAFTGVRQHQATWGEQHGYDLQTYATECGGFNKFGEDKQARYDLRRVLSLWMGGVPLACIYNLSVGGAGFTVVGEHPDGSPRPLEAYEALKRLTGIMAGCGAEGAGPAAPAFHGVTGNAWPMVSGAFTGVDASVLFVWQRTWGAGKGAEADGWYALASPAPATVTFTATEGSPTAVNVRTGALMSMVAVEPGVFSIAVADDPIAVIAGA